MMLLSQMPSKMLSRPGRAVQFLLFETSLPTRLDIPHPIQFLSQLRVSTSTRVSLHHTANMDRLKIELPRPSFKNGKLVDVISEPARIGAGKNKTASRPGLSQWVGMMLLEPVREVRK